MQFQDDVAAGVVLVRPAIQSPDYLTGVSGWAIKIDGTAEFNNVVIRGGTTVSGLSLYYDGTPALGNLIMSLSAAAGVDSFGNAYEAGLGLYSSSGLINISVAGGDVITTWADTLNGSSIDISVGGGSAGMSFTPPSGPAAGWESAGMAAGISNVFGTNTAQFSIVGAYNRAFASTPAISFFGSSDSSSNNRLDILTQQLNVSGLVAFGGVDVGQGVRSQVSITANITGITTTEVVVMTLPSMTYKDGRAYRVTLWGLQQSTTAATYFLHRLRKGSASTSGTIYKDQMRVPVINAASTNGPVSLTFELVNNTGADITTAVTWTTSCAAGTGIFAASAGNVAHATVEDVGLASAWPGQPIS